MPRAGLNRSVVTSIALDLVDESPAGFANLTLASVAAKVGVAVPSLYKHVSSLADVRRAVAVASVTELTDVIAAASSHRSAPDALRAMAGSVRGFAHAHPGRYAAAQVAPDLHDPADAELVDAANEIIAVMAVVLRDFELAPDLTTDAIRILRSALHGFIVLELGGGFGLPDDLDHSFELVVDSVIAGIERLAEDRPNSD